MANLIAYQLFFIIIICFVVLATAVNDYNQTNNHDDDDDDQSICECNESHSIEVFHYLNNLYEQNKNEPIVKHVDSFNDTMAIVDHLVKIVGKIINLEVDQQQMMILADIVINTNISNECLWSLAKISSGVFDRQIWALKCKRFFLFFIIQLIIIWIFIIIK